MIRITGNQPGYSTQLKSSSSTNQSKYTNNPVNNSGDQVSFGLTITKKHAKFGIIGSVLLGIGYLLSYIPGCQDIFNQNKSYQPEKDPANQYGKPTPEYNEKVKKLDKKISKFKPSDNKPEHHDDDYHKRDNDRDNEQQNQIDKNTEAIKKNQEELKKNNERDNEQDKRIRDLENKSTPISTPVPTQKPDTTPVPQTMPESSKPTSEGRQIPQINEVDLSNTNKFKLLFNNNLRAMIREGQGWFKQAGDNAISIIDNPYEKGDQILKFSLHKNNSYYTNNDDNGQMLPRAEVLTSPFMQPGNEYLIRFSVMLPEDYVSSKAWYNIFKLHQAQHNGVPPVALSIAGNQLGAIKYDSDRKLQEVDKFGNINDFKGKEIDIQVQAYISGNDDGYIGIYIRDPKTNKYILVDEYFGPTTYDEQGLYPKFGLMLQNEEDINTFKDKELVVYEDNIRIYRVLDHNK